MDGEGSLARESHGEGSGIGVNGTRRAPNQSHPLSVDGVSMKTTNAHALQMAQQDNENTAIDINELKRRIERRDAENKRKDREIILLQKEILNLTKNVQELRERNEQLHNSLSNTKLLAISTRNEQENQLTNSLIQDLQTKLSKLEKSYDELLHENEMYKANSSTLNEKILSNATSLEIRTQEVVSLKEENYSLNIKLKTLQIRLQEKDAEMEKLQVLNENLIKSERQLKHQLEHEKTVIYEHERTINDLLATNKRVMAANLIKNETNQFLKSELNVIRDGEGHGNEGGGVGGGSGGHLLSSTDLQLMKEVEKANHQLKERNKELQNSIELHMDLLQRCEQENGVLKLKLQEETNLREELQHEMKNNLENGNNKEMTYQQIKKEIVKLRKENKILSEKCDELMRSGGGNKGSGPGGHGRQNVNGGGGLEDQSFATRNGPSNGGGGNRSAMTGDERKKLKLLDETVKALRNRISFLLEQLSHLSQQSTAWNEQKLILKSQISSLLEANISLRERLLTVQRSFMERSLYEMDHPAVRRNAKAIFLTENEEERVMTTGQLNQMDGNEEYHQQFTTPEEVIEGAIVSHSLVPMPLKGLSQDPKAREARLLEYSMRSELGQPIPFTVEGFIERTLFDTLCAFTSGVRQASEAGNKSKHVMKPKVTSCSPLSPPHPSSSDSKEFLFFSWN